MKNVDLRELALKKVKITGNVIGKFGTFEIEQMYKNNTKEVLEVGYTFPIVETATVVGFEIKVGDKILKGKQNEYMQGNVIPKNILIAEFLGVPWMVVHPFKMQYVYGKDVERAKNIEYFKMLIPLLKQCNVGICFENLYEGIGQRLVEGVCADPDDAIWYLDTLNDYAGEE